MSAESEVTKRVDLSIIPSLDGFRAVSILIVAASHCGLGAVIPGGLGVTIFFFLSGYLITTLLLREINESQTINIGHFYLRRILRLYPPLIVTLALAYSLVYFGYLDGSASFVGALAQLFYFANYYQLFFGSADGVPAGTGILWSLAVEEHFYMVYPLLLLGFMRMGQLRRFPILLVALCVGALLWRVHLVSEPGFSPSRTYYASDTRFDSILYGCIFSFLGLRYNIGHTFSETKQSILAWIGIAGLLVSLIDRGTFFRETLRYSVQGLSLIPIFLYAISQRRSSISRFLNSAPMKKIGVYSYSIYLIHFILLSLLPNNFTGGTNPFLLLAVVVGGSCLYAFLIDICVDPLFRRMRKALHGSIR